MVAFAATFAHPSLDQHGGHGRCASGPAALTESRRLRQAAERDRLDAELALRQARETSAAVRQRAQELELRVLRQRLAQHEPRLLFLQQRIRDQSRASLQAVVEDVDARASALPTPRTPLGG